MSWIFMLHHFLLQIQKLSTKQMAKYSMKNTYQYSVYCPQEKLLQDTDDYVLLDDNFDISHEVAILDDIADDVCMLQSCWMTDNQ